IHAQGWSYFTGFETGMQQDVTVIIRSCGERTEAWCHEIVKAQVPDTAISIIREIPFVNAVRKTYSIGSDSGRKWTVAVDADILLTPGAIGEMIAQAEKLPSHTFVYQGCVLDKLLNGIRPGGPHLYRSEYLPLALRVIDDSAG